ncbi:MAG: hypothetical protein R2838_04500 [Caldilineaceae bacterium]
MVWSVMGEWRNRRLPYLSLHRPCPALRPLQPLLPPSWQPQPVSTDGTVDAADGWQLSSETVPAAARPETWRGVALGVLAGCRQVGSLALTVPHPA